MIKRLNQRWWRPLGLLGLLGVVGLAWGATPPAELRVVDPLDRPSEISTRAGTALMTAVTRAGARLVAVGDRGIVLTSDDDGQRWTQRPSPVSVLLTNVRFASAEQGWAVGHSGIVLGTVDGGLHWRRLLDGTKLAQRVLESAQARAAQVPPTDIEAAAAAAKAVEAARLLVQDGPDKPLFDVYVDADIGLLVVGAYGIVLWSGDGGASWESWQDRVPNAAGAHLYAAVRSGASLYLVGEQGAVFRSIDRGRTFTALATPYRGSFFGAAPLEDDDVAVFGLRGNAYAYRQAQQRWEALKLPTAATVNNGTRLQDGSTLLVTQAGEALRTVDGGRHFVSLKVPQSVPFVGVDQAADGTVVLAGVRGLTRVSLKSASSPP